MRLGLDEKSETSFPVFVNAPYRLFTGFATQLPIRRVLGFTGIAGHPSICSQIST